MLQQRAESSRAHPEEVWGHYPEHSDFPEQLRAAAPPCPQLSFLSTAPEPAQLLPLPLELAKSAKSCSVFFVPPGVPETQRMGTALKCLCSQHTAALPRVPPLPLCPHLPNPSQEGLCFIPEGATSDAKTPSSSWTFQTASPVWGARSSERLKAAALSW